MNIVITLLGFIGFIIWSVVIILLSNGWAILKNILLKLGVSYFWLFRIPKVFGFLTVLLCILLNLLMTYYVGYYFSIIWLSSFVKFSIKLILIISIGVIIDFFLFEKLNYQRELYSIWIVCMLGPLLKLVNC